MVRSSGGTFSCTPDCSLALSLYTVVALRGDAGGSLAEERKAATTLRPSHPQIILTHVRASLVVEVGGGSATPPGLLALYFLLALLLLIRGEPFGGGPWMVLRHLDLGQQPIDAIVGLRPAPSR